MHLVLLLSYAEEAITLFCLGKPGPFYDKISGRKKKKMLLTLAVV